MASSSSSFGVKKISKGPQVFINFRGEELRNGFIAHLEIALKKANINYFIDKQEQVGRLLQNLFFRIQQSRVALVIFSKEYTTSDWCLDELAKINECMDKGTLIGIPIFYRLETSVVKNLQGYFGDNFRTLKRNNQDRERTNKWEEALTSIPDILGIKLSEKSDKTDKEFIEVIIEKAKNLLDDIEKGENIDQKREQENSQCWMICARKIGIAHWENPKYWTWSSIKEPPNGVTIEIATMRKIWWMDIRGIFHTRKLTPETKYEVVFVVKLEETANGWEETVNLNMKLVMRDKSEIVQENKVYLDDFIGDEWVDIKVGDFVTPPKDATAKISFSMYQYDDTVRKNGLVVKGVAIRVVNQIQEQINCECSMIYARKLEITHWENPEYWTWSSIKEPPNGVTIEIATMRKIWWMDIRGIFHTKKLIPETKYEVVFMVKLEDSANGWEEPVNLNMKLVMRDKSEIVQEKKVYLDDFIGDEWVDIKVGDFVVPPKDILAKIFFTMYQHDDYNSKSGLVVKGVAIRVVN